MLSMLCKKIFRHYKYHKDTLRVNTENQEEGDDEPLVADEDWIADRMENPQKYNEKHVPVRLDDLTRDTDEPTDEPIPINEIATYGSV